MPNPDQEPRLADLKARSQEEYDLFRQAVAHLLMGLGGEDDKDTKARMKALGEISDRDVIGAIAAVLRQEAFIHKYLLWSVPSTASSKLNASTFLKFSPYGSRASTRGIVSAQYRLSSDSRNDFHAA